MKDYSSMSDFEINLLVNRSLGLKHYPNEEKKVIEIFGDIVIFDPCNNPADAWPIIEENGIGLRKQLNGPWVATQPGEMFPQYHDNPLRSAMIAYLMMKDAEKGHG